jgi:hypothetical protein
MPMFDWIFAFAHFFLFLGLLGYAFYSLIIRNYSRGILLLIFLGLYYFVILHKAVKKEVVRKRGGRAPK